jgi:uncharacterized membrane protein YqjE
LADAPKSSELAQAVQDVAERAQLLVREEIALAKAELAEKVSKLVKGAVIGAVAGVFALLALIKLLDAASWGVWKVVQGGGGDDFWLGFLIVAVVLLLLGALAGFVAARLLKRGSPPTPTMAIEEAQLIRQTISSAQPDRAARTPAPGAVAASPEAVKR